MENLKKKIFPRFNFASEHTSFSRMFKLSCKFREFKEHIECIATVRPFKFQMHLLRKGGITATVYCLKDIQLVALFPGHFFYSQSNALDLLNLFQMKITKTVSRSAFCADIPGGSLVALNWGDFVCCNYETSMRVQPWMISEFCPFDYEVVDERVYEHYLRVQSRRHLVRDQIDIPAEYRKGEVVKSAGAKRAVLWYACLHGVDF